MKNLRHGIEGKKLKKPISSRMYLVNPKDRQRYFIRLLLSHVKGATSFDNLRTVNCVIHPTFVNYIHLFVFIIILLMQENYMKNTMFSSIIPNMKKVLVKILH